MRLNKIKNLFVVLTLGLSTRKNLPARALGQRAG